MVSSVEEGELKGEWKIANSCDNNRDMKQHYAYGGRHHYASRLWLGPSETWESEMKVNRFIGKNTKRTIVKERGLTPKYPHVYCAKTSPIQNRIDEKRGV